MHAATDKASAPLDWRLFLPTKWDLAHTDEAAAEQIRQRRDRAGIPKEVAHKPKWQLALDMIDELSSWGQRPPVVCADAGYGNNGDFRHGLHRRGLAYITQVEDDLTAYPIEAVPAKKPYAGVGTYPLPCYRGAPAPLHQHIADAAADPTCWQQVTWREGSRGTMSGYFTALRLRPAGRKHTHRLNPDGSLDPAWLLVQWPTPQPSQADEDQHRDQQVPAEPVKYWLSNLPEDTPLAELVRLGKIRWRIEHDYRELKEALGLDRFEGRTWNGWHRHVTLVSAAHVFATVLRADPDPKHRGAA